MLQKNGTPSSVAPEAVFQDENLCILKYFSANTDTKAREVTDTYTVPRSSTYKHLIL